MRMREGAPPWMPSAIQALVAFLRLPQEHRGDKLFFLCKRALLTKGSLASSLFLGGKAAVLSRVFQAEV